MTHHDSNATTYTAALDLLIANGFDDLARPLEMLINAAMLLERSAYLSASPWERSEERRGYANGFKSKSMTTRLGKLDLEIPKTRDLAEGVEPFYPKSLERGERSEQALRLALAEMYIQGVSTRKVKTITEKLCGTKISSSQVSRLVAELDVELDAWRVRPLGAVRYVVLDATYVKVRHAGSVMDCAVLIATGVRVDGKRSVLGVSVSLSEAEVHWRVFLEGLVQRGLCGVTLVTSDDHSGLRAALRAVLPSVAWQRCQVHLQRNAAAYVPKVDMRPKVASRLRSIFNAASRVHADQLLREVVAEYSESAPRLAAWMDENIPEGLNVFALPEHHRRRLRTSNMLERLNCELKRRTRVATLFQSEASLLRLATAVLAEVSDDWETGRIYLTMETN